MAKFRKIHLFTHDDLDGYACEVVVEVYRRLLWTDTELYVKHCNYGQIDQCIQSSFDNHNIDRERDLVIIADISWRRDNFELTANLRSLSYLIVADHHKSSEWISSELETVSKIMENKYRMVFTHDGSICGCLILDRMMDLLHQQFVEHNIGTDIDWEYTNTVKGRLDQFCGIVNDWDVNFGWVMSVPDDKTLNIRWILSNCKSPMMDALLQYDHKHFVKTIVRTITKHKFCVSIDNVFNVSGFEDYVKKIAKEIDTITRQYYRYTIKSEYFDAVTVFISVPKNFKYKSLVSYIVGNLIDDRHIECDCVSLWEEGADTLSLRYGQYGLDLSKIAETSRYGGGGHPFAAGMRVNTDEMWKVVRCTDKYLF